MCIALVQVLFCKAHILRNIVSNFAELRELGVKSFRLIKACLFAVSQDAFEEALTKLDDAYKAVATNKKLLPVHRGADAETSSHADNGDGDKDDDEDDSSVGNSFELDN